MSPVLDHYFLVNEPHQKILTQLIEGVQRTPLWDRIKGSCFVMAGFVQLAFEALGHEVQILPCTGLALYQGRPFKLGFPGIKKDVAQVDGHVACVIDQRIIVDFGLGNVRRYGFPDFPMALGADCKQVPIFPVILKVHDDLQFQWDTQKVHPEIEQAVQNHLPLAKKLFEQYQALSTR